MKFELDHIDEEIYHESIREPLDRVMLRLQEAIDECHHGCSMTLLKVIDDRLFIQTHYS